LGRFLRKDDIKDLRERVEKALALGELLIPRGSKVEGFSFNGGEVFSVNDDPSFYVGSDGSIIPLLIHTLKSNVPLPRITVDMKAVPHICNGADVFRPGVRNIDVSIKLGQTVIVVDEKNQKPICVGTGLMEGKSMQGVRQGKVVRNVHYVGDALWDFSRSLSTHQPKDAKAST
jgi:PUA domain protein